MSAMLKDAELPLEFCDKDVDYDADIRNCTNIGPDSNSIHRSLTEAFIGTLPDIDLGKTWRSKYYSYINPKTIPNGQRHDKLPDIGRVGVFLGDSNYTTKYIKVYSPELRYTRCSNRIIIDETHKEGDLNLWLRNSFVGLQGMKNMVSHRKPGGRLKMEQPIDPCLR
jgi:hypothetical protein